MSRFPFLSVLVLVVSLVTPLPTPALAASVGVHFQGTFSLGATPAPAGTTVTVIVARSVDDVTICGSGSVSSATGVFRVDTQATPPCVNSATSRNNGPYVFVANGENVGACACAPTLESPTSLGRTQHMDLNGSAISLSAAGCNSGGAMMVPAVRLWGTLTLVQTSAPTGTGISASASRSQGQCGTGTVIDNSGTYWLDVPANANCANSLADGNPGPYIPLSAEWIGQQLKAALDGDLLA